MSQENRMFDSQTLKAALSKTPSCLPIEELEKLSIESAQQHPHVSNCLHCQAELSLLSAFESDAPLPDEGAAVAWISAQLERQSHEVKGTGRTNAIATVSSSWLGRLFQGWDLRILAPVGGLAAVIAVTTFIALRPDKQPDLRAGLGSGPAVYRSQQVELVGPSGELTKVPEVLEWKGFPGASKYKVSIMEVDRNPLWNGETAGMKVSVPAVTRGKMLPGKTVLWQVTALDAQGKILAVSQAERMVVSPRHPAQNP